MPEVATLDRPTARDEEWRYADAGWLTEADPAVLARWDMRAIPDGESVAETHMVAPGAERIRVILGRDARFELHAINAAGPYARLEVEVTLAEGAHFEFGGVTLGGGDKVQEIVTRVIHAEPGATSNQTVRAVHWGRATGNFLGRVEVVRQAQKTDAAQNFRAILLEKGASANAKPELEIFADDVKCAHGAAIGELDRQAAFYMAARGLPPEVARKLLVQAFIGDAFAAITDDAMRDKMLARALDALDEAKL